MTERQHDLVIIGAGPGGYVAAIRAAQLGLDTACVEREPRLGGTCLRVGCVPSKVLLESSEQYHELRGGQLAARGIKTEAVSLDLPAMLARKDKLVGELTDGVAGLFKKNKVTRYEGTGRLDGPGKVAVAGKDAAILSAKHVLIATGSVPASLPGIELDGEMIGDSTTALSYTEVPRHLVVIGAGYIGLELGSVWRRLGAEVTVVEYLDRILPGTDLEIAREALKLFKRQGMQFVLKARVTGARRQEGDDKNGAVVEIEGRDPLAADRVLVAVGRKPHTDGLGLASLGIALDERGRIPVNEHFETTAAGVYAIGDVIDGPMLAHKAEEEGIACVERIVTGWGHVDRGTIPGVCYTDPEIAGVGRTEEQLTEDGTPFRKGVFFFRANSRARALDRIDGRVKILAHTQTDRILGVHMIGPRAGDLIAEAVAAMSFGASSEDLARVCHAHPTLSEAVKEAALAVAGRALHA
ncbi:MAG: dihydrolipoyl dehydrogenase [Candidatus Krumholzibacteria bacterium]|jgi:dihydrolipoamide dehydrogenase|nr:dihydrolipoyl dehydrogenase [Candidatus Krumholzibacteria bacterium]